WFVDGKAWVCCIIAERCCGNAARPLDHCEDPIPITKARPDEHCARREWSNPKRCCGRRQAACHAEAARLHAGRERLQWRASDSEKEQRRKSRREPALP